MCDLSKDYYRIYERKVPLLPLFIGLRNVNLFDYGNCLENCGVHSCDLFICWIYVCMVMFEVVMSSTKTCSRLLYLEI